MFEFSAYVMYCCYTTVLSSIMSNKLFLKLKLKLKRMIPIVMSSRMITIMMSSRMITIVMSSRMITIVMSSRMITTVMSSRMVSIVVSSRMVSIVVSSRMVPIVMSSRMITIVMSSRVSQCGISLLSMWRHGTCGYPYSFQPIRCKSRHGTQAKFYTASLHLAIIIIFRPGQNSCQFLDDIF